MFRKTCLFLICVAALAKPLGAAPVTDKELDLMVRMHTSDDEILADVARRRLLAPLDDAAAAKLTSDGASAALINKLKNGGYALPPDQAAQAERRAAEQSALVARERAQDQAAYSASLKRQFSDVPTSDGMARMLSGKLVHLENGVIQPYAEDQLKRVRYFVFYYSASWCAPCRAFTPKLVEYYRKMKPEHPEFEIILVGRDKTPEAADAYVKTDAMPWAEVNFSKIDASVLRYSASGIPYLAIVNDAGERVYPKNPDIQNKIPMEWSDPGVTLSVLDAVLRKTPTEIRLNPPTK